MEAQWLDCLDHREAIHGLWLHQLEWHWHRLFFWDNQSREYHDGWTDQRDGDIHTQLKRSSENENR